MTELTSAPRAHHGEGPVWFADEGVLRWVDMLVGDVLSWNPETGAAGREHIAPVVTAIRPRSQGGYVAAVERGFALVPGDGSSPALLPEVWSDPTVRMNDGGCDALGRFYCGSMAYDSAPGRGALYRLDPDGTASWVLGDVTISNGVAWTTDGEHAYYVDSATQRIDVFDVERESGRLLGRRTLVTIPLELGVPDGICLDSEGGIWVALWDGWAVHRYSPVGRLDHRIEIPVPRPTACTFGGTGLDELYVTSSSNGLTPDSESGSLYRIIPGVRGSPPHTFAG